MPIEVPILMDGGWVELNIEQDVRMCVSNTTTTINT